ncbi:hypothetical protein THIOM_004732 [Candidatus Thiomargarita nelsonii]|uniref:Uncharacterized protein n=1 Tax=Candidatus Thiomargarita nelsonii TaxID=1003181 RepID=A0A176RV59_9GAMM|nr:hypothetical protein THIOM_004732 [Candidatus Thiomargarita nelsonii]
MHHQSIHQISKILYDGNGLMRDWIRSISQNCFLIHDWDGCICKACRKKRDKHHVLKGCTCKKCGVVIHDWSVRTCIRCGEFKSDNARKAQDILNAGGPRNRTEYFFLFPDACRNCGARRLDEYWGLVGGTQESHGVTLNPSYALFRKCFSCGNDMAVDGFGDYNYHKNEFAGYRPFTASCQYLTSEEEQEIDYAEIDSK